MRPNVHKPKSLVEQPNLNEHKSKHIYNSLYSLLSSAEQNIQVKWKSQWEMSSMRRVEEEVEDEERRRQRKVEEALEIKSLRRIISAYLKYSYSPSSHLLLRFYLN